MIWIYHIELKYLRSSGLSSFWLSWSFLTVLAHFGVTIFFTAFALIFSKLACLCSSVAGLAGFMMSFMSFITMTTMTTWTTLWFHSFTGNTISMLIGLLGALKVFIRIFVVILMALVSHSVTLDTLFWRGWHV